MSSSSLETSNAASRAVLSSKEAATYNLDRTFGTTGAKTIRSDDGGISITVHAGTLVVPELARRILAHEAMHAATMQWGEWVDDIQSYAGLSPWTVRDELIRFAWIALDEIGLSVA